MHLQSSSPFERYMVYTICYMLFAICTVSQVGALRRPKKKKKQKKWWNCGEWKSSMDTWQHSIPCGRSATLANQIGRQVFCCATEAKRDRMCGIYSGGFHSFSLLPFLVSFFFLVVGQSPDNKHTVTWNRCLGYMLSMKWLNGENTQETIERRTKGARGYQHPSSHMKWQEKIAENIFEWIECKHMSLHWRPTCFLHGKRKHDVFWENLWLTCLKVCNKHSFSCLRYFSSLAIKPKIIS